MNQRKRPSKLPTSIRLTEVRRLKGQRLQLLKDYAYGAEAFEAYMEKSNRELKPNMKEVAVQKNDKAR